MSLRLGLFHPNARSIHAMSPEALGAGIDPLDIDAQVGMATLAESIGLDYLFMADAWGPYGPHSSAMGLQDPILLPPMLAACLIPVTKRIRLISTVHTSWFAPLPVARIGAALDTLSRGRWGINLVTGAGMAPDLLESTGAVSDHDDRYAHAGEFVDALTQVWSSGRVDLDGKYIQLKGQMVGPRTVQQPRPLLVSAGASEAGRVFAGRHADVVFMPGRTPKDECLSRFADIERHAEAAGRPKGAVRLQMHVSVLVRESHKEAQAASEALAAGVDLKAVAEYLNGVRANISTYDDIYASLGDLEMREIGSVAGAKRIHGGPREVADGIERLIVEFGVNGLALTLPTWSIAELERVGDLLLPELERRGLWTRPHTRGFGW